MIVQTASKYPIRVYELVQFIARDSDLIDCPRGLNVYLIQRWFELIRDCLPYLDILATRVG